jgi:hypothetical protein
MSRAPTDAARAVPHVMSRRTPVIQKPTVPPGRESGADRGPHSSVNNLGETLAWTTRWRHDCETR